MPRSIDLRTLAVAAAAWAGALLARVSPGWVVVVGGLLVVAGLVGWWRSRTTAAVTVVGVVVVFAAVATVASVRAARVSDNPLTGLAVRRAEVTLTARVAADPVPVHSRFGEQVMVRLSVRRV